MDNTMNSWKCVWTDPEIAHEVEVPSGDDMSAGGVSAVDYPGRAVSFPDGAFVGMRTFATRTGARTAPSATIDLRLPGIPINKVKFTP
jgi:hypothetical protein